jgi:hypothetical protein
VLQALDRQHGKLVALKVYPVTSVDDRDELLAEARVLLSVTPHPSLPVVRADFFTDDLERYVVVMDWVDGVDLQLVLDDEGDPGLPLPEVLDAVAQAAAALDHLHAQEPPIVHGDVKPANLVRTPAGKVVLVDFDIAGARGSGGRSAGTPGFMAQEVLAGDKPGPEADVYGLAATVVTLLNGDPPNIVQPVWPGIERAQAAALASTLRAALSPDPVKRPSSAGRLVEQLRRADLSAGLVALLATEVVDSGRLWDDDAAGMRTAMARVADLLAQVVERRGGRIVTTMNEGDRTIAVFSEGSEAALAALELQQSVERETFPAGIDVQLRAAVEIGKADLVNGSYSGAPVDRVRWLGSIAAPGATLTSEATAELLLERFDEGISFVPLGHVTTKARPRGAAVYGIALAGGERAARLDPEVTERSTPQPAEVSKSAAVTDEEARRHLVAEAVEHPATLVSLTITGLAFIYLVVLAPETGAGALALVVLILSAVAMVGSFAWRYTVGYGEEEAKKEIEKVERDAEAAALERLRTIAKQRGELEEGFARIGSDAGSRVLHDLTEEFAALETSLQEHEESAFSLAHILPSLVDDTYQRGLSVLLDALDLLERSESPRRRRLEYELDDINDRLQNDDYDDARERARDERRKLANEDTLAALDRARETARDLLFQAETCETALHRANIELASVRAGAAQVSVDSVIQTLEENIQRVREVQDELRKFQY